MYPHNKASILCFFVEKINAKYSAIYPLVFRNSDIDRRVSPGWRIALTRSIRILSSDSKRSKDVIYQAVRLNSASLDEEDSLMYSVTLASTLLVELMQSIVEFVGEQKWSRHETF